MENYNGGSGTNIREKVENQRILEPFVMHLVSYSKKLPIARPRSLLTYSRQQIRIQCLRKMNKDFCEKKRDNCLGG